MLKRLLLSLALTLPVAAHVCADVKLPHVIGDHMVLQQGMPNTFWGWAKPGEKVTITLGESNAHATADEKGRWKTKLDPPEAGGPYVITIEGANTITLKNVLCGEVWVCSGQSNMEWSVARSADAQSEIENAKHPRIRLYSVPRNIAEKPVDDLNSAWVECSPESVGRFSAVAYYFGRELQKELKVPVGLIKSAWGGTVAEAWMSREGLQDVNDLKPLLDRAAKYNARTPNQATNLYDGMIHPIQPITIRGAIWYQGESNVKRAAQYAQLFPALITDWRRTWGQGDFPFIFVQLAPFRYGRHDAAFLAELWDAQLKTLKSVPNTGMAVTTDIGNIKDIHPKNKQDVGKRLALWALGTTYEKEIAYSGPIYKSHEVIDGKVVITFDHVYEGLKTSDGKDLSNFTIAGSNGKFVIADAEIEGDKVVVSSSKVSQPTAVRFAWSDTAEPNLVNKADLPATPFRTDDLPLLTEGRN